MGWKALKTHYKIEHIVQVTQKGICIGSGYVHDLAVINPETGKAQDNKTFAGFLRERYPALADADASFVLALIKADDVFEQSLPVYTYDGSEILEKWCEAYGYPNITHDGCQIYENTFFQNREDAIEKAKESARYGIENYVERVAEIEQKLVDARRALAEQEANLVALDAMTNQGV